MKTIHFVSPSIWAWRGKRIEKIGRATDLVLCIFPFEPEIYAKHGHQRGLRRPSARQRDPDRAAARRRRAPRSASAPTRPLVAMLPGSRRSEIQYIAPRLFGAAARDAPRPGPALRFVVPVVTGPAPRRSSRCAGSTRPMRRSTLLDGQAHEALAACDVALVASGTATLEAALFKRPMVVVYAMHCAQLADGQAHDTTSPGSRCPTSCCATSPCPSCCRATRRRRRSPPRPSSGSTIPAACRVAAASASRRSTGSCARHRARSPPMRSKPSSPADRHARQDLLSRRQAARASSTSPG